MLKKTLLICLLISAVLVALRRYGRQPGRILFMHSFHQFDSRGKQLALTFDDGPSPQITPALLAILRQQQVKASFFVVGKQVEKHPEIARQIVDEGHLLANHSYAQERMVCRSFDFIKEDLLRTDSLLRLCGQQDPVYFRPPYGDKFLLLPLVLRQLGKSCVEWNIDPPAQYQPVLSKEQLVRQIVGTAAPGSIILLHDGWSNHPALFLEAVAESIVLLKQKGFSFVTIDEVINNNSAPF